VYTYLKRRGEVERERERERTIYKLSLALPISILYGVCGGDLQDEASGGRERQVGTYIRNTRFTETGILGDMHMVSVA